MYAHRADDAGTTATDSSPWAAQVVDRASRVAWTSMDDVLEHDVEWLRAQCDRPGKEVLVLADGAGRVVPFFVHDGFVGFELGEVSLGSTAVRRHVLVGNFTALSVDDWTALLGALAGRLERGAAVFLLGVVEGEALEAAVSRPEVQRLFLRSWHGPAYERRLCRLEGSLDAYLASLASGRRQDLKRSLRRFENEFRGRHELRVFASEDDVGTFLDTIEPASQRTYQARLRRLGIRRDGYVGHEALEGARRGYARCYLLLVDGQPVAWRIGYLYRGSYYSHHIGYDPDFEHWHPGVVLHLKVIDDLTARVPGVAMLDMLYGDNAFKRKAANCARRERNVYLFPRTFRGTLTYLALRSCNAVSEAIGRAMEISGLKERLKHWIRRA